MKSKLNRKLRPRDAIIKNENVKNAFQKSIESCENVINADDFFKD